MQLRRASLKIRVEYDAPDVHSAFLRECEDHVPAEQSEAATDRKKPRSAGSPS